MKRQSFKIFKIILLILALLAFIEFTGFPLFTDFHIRLYFENTSDAIEIEIKHDPFGSTEIHNIKSGLDFRGKLRLNIIDRMVLEYKLQKFKFMQPTDEDELSRKRDMRVDLMIDNKQHKTWGGNAPFSAKFRIPDDENANIEYSGSRELIELIMFLFAQDVKPIVGDGYLEETSYYLYPWAREFHGKLLFEKM